MRALHYPPRICRGLASHPRAIPVRRGCAASLRLPAVRPSSSERWERCHADAASGTSGTPDNARRWSHTSAGYGAPRPQSVRHAGFALPVSREQQSVRMRTLCSDRRTPSAADDGSSPTTPASVRHVSESTDVDAPQPQAPAPSSTTPAGPRDTTARTLGAIAKAGHLAFAWGAYAGVVGITGFPLFLATIMGGEDDFPNLQLAFGAEIFIGFPALVGYSVHKIMASENGDTQSTGGGVKPPTNRDQTLQ